MVGFNLEVLLYFNWKIKTKEIIGVAVCEYDRWWQKQKRETHSLSSLSVYLIPCLACLLVFLDIAAKLSIYGEAYPNGLLVKSCILASFFSIKISCFLFFLCELRFFAGTLWVLFPVIPHLHFFKSLFIGYDHHFYE